MSITAAHFYENRQYQQWTLKINFMYFVEVGDIVLLPNLT
jgi:hypothetical protein